MPDQSKAERTMTQFLWAGAVLLFILSEAQIVVSYVRASSQHTWFDLGRLLATLLVLSVPGIAGLRGYSVVKRLPPAISGDDQARLVWLAHQFLTIVIFVYVAIGWVTRQGLQ
ncbi:MAG TPA: hypothetical protein VHN10_08285 [Candidatus Acidoferrales bacterium]|jgi:hypothetical protein|nr:hypothetical protein [Candidatus Acidoferrales bacterium]